MVSDSRINVAGLRKDVINYLASAIANVFKAAKICLKTIIIRIRNENLEEISAEEEFPKKALIMDLNIMKCIRGQLKVQSVLGGTGP